MEAPLSAESSPLNEPSGSLRTWLLVLVFALSFGFRAGYLLTAEQTPLLPFCDASAYRAAGQAISHLEFSPTILNRMGQQGPIYPLFLGLVFWLQGGDGVDSIRWMQALLDSCTCLLAALVAVRLAGNLAALLTGLLLAGHPGLILHTGTIHTETLATCLLWLAVYGLVRLPDTGAKLLTILAGSLLGLACLTRVTLLPVVPFLVLAACATAKADWASRTARTLWYGLGCVLVLGCWSLSAKYALRIENSTVAGSAVELQLGIIRAAADPARQGWSITSGLPGEPPARESSWQSGPIATAAILTQIAFCQVWFSDNIWRESYLLDPSGMDMVQRFLTICAVFGAFFVLLHKREGSGRNFVLLALVMGLLGTAVKYIEIRPTLPYQPALAVLAGTFLAALAPACRRILPWMASVALVAFFVVTRFSVLTRLFPVADPQTLGNFSDVAVVLALAGIGALVSTIMARQLPLARAWLTGCGAMMLLVIGYGCAVRSIALPRWRAWQIVLAQQAPDGVRQEIRLPQSIDPAEVDTVTCLADLTSHDGLPLLDLNVNGVTLENASWQPARPWSEVYQAVFSGLTHFTGREWQTWPQWWETPLPLSVLTNGTDVTLEVRARQSGVELGGTYGPTEAGGYCGPALIRNSWVSCYRWEVLEDWRVWEAGQLASVETTGRLVNSNSPEAEYLSGALQRQQAGLGIRMVIRYKDGRRLVY